ncbi:MAG: class II aldolase/adducin family protein [Chloroflexi bacterium]|nr:class II aldolase/adducin family protein [Chloroflexota bacterium]
MRDQELRERLALACRVLYCEGHDHYFLGHLSARASSGDAIWVKPAGLGLEEIQADDLALMDLDGRKLEGTHPLHNEMPIHTEIYRRRGDVHAIVHTHPFYATALASSQARFELVGQDSVLFARGVGRYPSAELVTAIEQGQRVADALGDLRAVLMKNHGITVVGETIEQATVWAASLERSCRVQLAATQFGPLAPIAPDEVERMEERFERGYAGRTEALWRYLARKAERSAVGRRQ